MFRDKYLTWFLAKYFDIRLHVPHSQSAFVNMNRVFGLILDFERAMKLTYNL